jgi:3-oxoadipyl-CoA thiolase
MLDAYLCDAVRTPFGRYGGALSAVRTDDLGAIPLSALLARNPQLEAALIDDVILGCANQSGEDNRNVARMALLLAGLPETVPGLTVNRLCGSGLDAIAAASRMIRSGEADLVLAGGVESMSRAPFVIGKAASPFGRDVQMFDTTMGWRFVNPLLEERHGVDTMPQTAENVAARFNIGRGDQDRFALRSQERALAAQARGLFASEIVPVAVAGKKGEMHSVDRDEHPRATSLDALSRLPTPFREGGSVTAGNSSGINDGAAAVLVASETAARRHGLTPRARVLGVAVAGVEPRIMGMGPVPATHKLVGRLQLPLSAFDVIEVNEAFAAQALAVLRALGIPDDADYVNAYGGAIALGHPLGASGARLVTTALNQLARTGRRRAICTMCIGVGQGIALAMERV